MKKALILIVALLACPFFANAQTSCGVNADVYYINGVNNPDYYKVKEQADILFKKFKSISKYSSNVRRVKALHNHSDGLFLDVIFEFAQQKAIERAKDVSELFVSFGMTALGHLGLSSEADTNYVQQVVAKMIGANLTTSSLVDMDAFKAEITQKSLNTGVQAVLVSHSQGNMFANIMFDDLKASTPARYFRGLGVVNVANPANRAPSNLYLTVQEDLVIGGLSLLSGVIAAPLPANFSATGANLIDPMGHGFLDVYLSLRLPAAADVSNSVGWALVNKIDTALYRTSTFLDAPGYIFDAAGNKVAKPVWYPADSTSVLVCFPGAVGGF